MSMSTIGRLGHFGMTNVAKVALGAWVQMGGTLDEQWGNV